MSNLDKYYINGKWVQANNSTTFNVTNPSDQSFIGNVPDLGVAETRKAIECANEALIGWKKISAGDRAKFLRRWYDLIIENIDDLAKILTLEQGKPLNEAKGEILYGASFVEWFAEEAKRIYGDVIKLEADFGFYRAFDNSSRLFNKSLGGGSLLDIGIYPIFASLSALGIPKHIKANATYFENGADSSCDMVFEYEKNVKAILKSTLIEDTPTEAIFYCKKGIIKINHQFHNPSTISLIPNEGEAETIDFNNKTIGYNYEAIHFNELLRQGKTESNVMSFEFSQSLIKTLDDVRNLINLNY